MNVRNKLAARHISIIEKGPAYRPVVLSGEFLPDGSYLPGFIAKFLCLTIKYCKKKFHGKEKNSMESLIIQEYLISSLQPGQEKDKYFPGIPVIGIEIA